jgi:Kdo2-lipid IVA lauroyltransferase/acyltransferase
MIAHKDVIKDCGRLLFWFPLRWIIQAASFEVVYRLGGMFGQIDYLLSGRTRSNKMARHMAGALDCSLPAARRLVKMNLQNHSRNVLELIKYPQIEFRDLQRLLLISGRRYLDGALQKGQGVILLTAHLGAKQFLQVALPLLDYKVSQIYYHMNHNELTYIQKQVSQKQRLKIEGRLPVNFIGAKGFLRSAFKCLKKNQVLIMAGDGIGLKQHMDKSYQPIKLLGKLMLFPLGPAAMARRTGASLVPAFVVRKRRQLQIVICPTIDNAAESTETAMCSYVGLLERFIRRYPSQWEFWEEFEEGFLLTKTKGKK